MHDISVCEFIKIWNVLREHGQGSTYFISSYTDFPYEVVQEAMEFTQAIGWASQDKALRWRLIDEARSYPCSS
jgi:hypothetical protein